MNTVAFSRGDLDQGLAYGEASLQIARELNLREQIGYTLNSFILIYFNNNLVDKGKELLDEVHDIWIELDNLPMLADSYSMTGYSYLMSGDYKAAFEVFAELERISEAINNTWNLSASKLFLGLCSLETGLISQGMSYLDEAVELNASPDLASDLLLAKVILAGGYSILGEFDKAYTLAEEVYQQRGDIHPQNWPLLMGLISSMYVRCGALSKAHDILEELADFDRASGSVWFASFIVCAEAELALAEDRLNEVNDLVEPHVQRMLEHGAHSNLPCLYYLQGQSYLALGDRERAFSTFESALVNSKLTGERTWRWQIQAAMHELAASEEPPDFDASAHWRAEAQETINFIAENIQDEDLRRTFYARDEISPLLTVGTPE
jgi:tetratricopeptide (TPR) repeat protein